MAREVGEASPFRHWRPTEVVPGPGLDDDGWRDFVAHSASTRFHPVGTAGWVSTTSPPSTRV